MTPTAGAPDAGVDIVRPGPLATVSAVLIAYDGPPDVLQRAIDSLRRQTLAPAEIICVDQSHDGRFARLLAADDGLRVIRLDRNVGYPSACNVAAKVAAGEYLLFLNPDAHADPDCAEWLVAALAEHPDAAIAGAQVLLPGGDRVNAGDNVLHLSGLSWAGRYGLAPEEGTPRAAAVVSGAALVARRLAFSELGGFTEGFFMYYDDVDLAWRARLLDWRVLFCPRARVEHDYEFIKGDYKWHYLERNRWWCLLAHFETRTLVLLAPMLAVTEIAIWARAAAEGWLGVKLGSYGALWKDRRDLRARRRQIQATRRVTDRAIVSGMRTAVDSPFLASRAARLADPALRAYGRLVDRLVR